MLVANGGITALPETGRAKLDLARMDSSLVRLDAANGALRGQWRLPDPRLSLRHLAWADAGGGSQRLGIALQAQHEDMAARRAAPVLALFDGAALWTPAVGQRVLAGYGGDIAAAHGHFAVSCPRAGGVAWFDARGTTTGWQPLDQACPLAASPGQALWAGGRGQALAMEAGAVPARALVPAPQQLDNHWLLW